MSTRCSWRKDPSCGLCPGNPSSLSGGSSGTWRAWARSVDLLLAIRQDMDLLEKARICSDALEKDAPWVSHCKEQFWAQTSHLRSVPWQEKDGLPISSWLDWNLQAIQYLPAYGYCMRLANLKPSNLINTQCRKLIPEMGTQSWSQAARSASHLDEVATPPYGMDLLWKCHFGPCPGTNGATTRPQAPREMIYLLTRDIQIIHPSHLISAESWFSCGFFPQKPNKWIRIREIHPTWITKHGMLVSICVFRRLIPQERSSTTQL